WGWLRGRRRGPNSPTRTPGPLGSVGAPSRAAPSRSSPLSAGNAPVDHTTQLAWLGRREITFRHSSSIATRALPCASWPVTTLRMDNVMSLPRDQKMPEAPRPGIVALHGAEDTPQIAPRRRVAVKPVEKQQIRDQACHPVDARRVADHRAHAGLPEKRLREALALHAAEHAACGEVDQVPIAAP